MLNYGLGCMVHRRAVHPRGGGHLQCDQKCDTVNVASIVHTPLRRVSVLSFFADGDEFFTSYIFAALTQPACQAKKHKTSTTNENATISDGATTGPMKCCQ